MGSFEDESLADALDRAVRNAKHLRARHAATVKAARMLAAKIDAWDTIVQWAQEDAARAETRPAVPQHDNVSMASFLKYLDALGLVPEKAAKPGPGRPATTESAPTPPKDDIAAMRARLRSG